MSAPRIGKVTSSIQVEPTRPRETPRPTLSFQGILRGGASVLLAGAQAASTVVGGPLLTAAVARARAGADAALAAGSSSASASAPPASESDALRAMQQDRASEDLKLIALQSEIQRHDRQITLLSNMLKARHDTAKAAIGNIRS